MRFHVPQFIEVESKIFGPLTLKQFIYLAGGAGLSALLWFFIPWRFVSILLIIPVVLFALALAFYKVNEKPFIEVLEAAFFYVIRSKLFLWKKQPKKTGETKKEKYTNTPAEMPRLSRSKLQEMTWDLDVSSGTSVENIDEIDTEEDLELGKEKSGNS